MIDELRLLKGENFKINEHITIKHPMLREIVEIGEENYSQLISLFCLTPYDLKVVLDDNGIDYIKLDNYQVFLMQFTGFVQKDCFKWLVGDYDFEIKRNIKNDTHILYDYKKKVVIDEYIFNKIAGFLKKINFITEKPQFKPANKKTRHFLIEQERRKLKKKQKLNTFSQLANIISAVTWKSANINISNIWDLHIYQLYNGFYRLQKIDNNNNIMVGVYSGTIDTTKINLEEINWGNALNI